MSDWIFQIVPLCKFCIHFWAPYLFFHSGAHKRFSIFDQFENRQKRRQCKKDAALKLVHDLHLKIKSLNFIRVFNVFRSWILLQLYSHQRTPKLIADICKIGSLYLSCYFIIVWDRVRFGMWRRSSLRSCRSTLASVPVDGCGAGSRVSGQSTPTIGNFGRICTQP